MYIGTCTLIEGMHNVPFQVSLLQEHACVSAWLSPTALDVMQPNANTSNMNKTDVMVITAQRTKKYCTNTINYNKIITLYKEILTF